MKAGTEREFALWANAPDRQREAVELLRSLAPLLETKRRKPTHLAKLLSENGEPQECWTKTGVVELSNDIEDGQITRDKYGDKLGIMLVPDVLNALKEELNAPDGQYRRFKWAVAVLESIWETLSDDEKKDCRVISYGY